MSPMKAASCCTVERGGVGREHERAQGSRRGRRRRRVSDGCTEHGRGESREVFMPGMSIVRGERHYMHIAITHTINNAGMISYSCTLTSH